jgi:hypothetical protein
MFFNSICSHNLIISAESLKGDDEENVQSFPSEIIDLFREGEFKNAPVKVQEAWFLFLGTFLTAAYSSWNKKDTKETRLLSTVITPSDETLALWILKFYHKDWKNEVSMEEESVLYPPQDDEGKNKKGKGKKAGKHKSVVYAAQYIQMHAKTVAKRELDKSWDEAYMKSLVPETDVPGTIAFNNDSDRDDDNGSIGDGLMYPVGNFATV